MSSDLEAKIRTMVRRGHMVHLSLSSRPGGETFEASFRDASRGPTRWEQGTDPVLLLKSVLKAPAEPVKKIRRSDFI